MKRRNFTAVLFSSSANGAAHSLRVQILDFVLRRMHCHALLELCESELFSAS